jgi:hypothetical protein
VPDAREKTRLLGSRNDAKTQLVERIKRAGDICADDIQSEAELEAAEEKEKRWAEFNRELLLRLFTTGEYAWEYDSARRPVRVIADRYIDASLHQLAERLVGSVKSQISTLRSIIERLDLIDEGGMLVADSSGAAQAERNLQLLI